MNFGAFLYESAKNIGCLFDSMKLVLREIKPEGDLKRFNYCRSAVDFSVVNDGLLIFNELGVLLC